MTKLPNWSIGRHRICGWAGEIASQRTSLGLSRDLMIRALANELQERVHGGPSAALRRRLQTLARELAKGGLRFDPGIVPKTGTTLVRQWRGHAHTVLVRENGF